MSCGNHSNTSSSGHCVCEVVRAIKDIQDNATTTCECPTNCFNEPLGSLVSPANATNADTRVFILSTDDGTPFSAFFRGTQNACVSIFFRVEDVFDNCCATLRVLVPGTMNGNTFTPVNLVCPNDPCCIDLTRVCDVNAFRSTNNCITVDLKCFCAIQCVTDVHLGICQG